MIVRITMNLPPIAPPDVIEELRSALEGAAVMTAAAMILVALGLGTLIAVCLTVWAHKRRLASLAAGSGLGPPTVAPITIVRVRSQPHTEKTGSSGDRESHAVSAWRFHQAMTTGLPIEQALELADDTDVDIHRLSELVRRGCPVDLAARIVAPLTPRKPAGEATASDRATSVRRQVPSGSSYSAQ